MFEGVIRSKFYTKCKSAIKLTKTRIEMIQKKRNAMQKYLRNDIADLLKTDLDSNAYGRVEGLLVELNMSSCYDFVEKFCGCILNHLSLMSKQRECPEECKEAVSSLMFAAARFADLPELRDLRSVFTGRYGSSIDSCVNQEFVEKLKSMPPTKDIKLQLMQDIGLEYSIEWDSKALQQKLYNPPAPKQDWTKNANDDHDKSHKSRDKPVGKIDNHDAGNKHNNVRDYMDPKRNKEDLLSYGGKQVDNDKYKLHNHRENVSRKVDNPGNQFQERAEITPSKDVQVAGVDRNAVKSVSKEEVDDKKPFYNRLIPPPYVKLKVSKNETILEVPRAGNVMGRTGTTKLSGHVEGENNHDQDKLAGEAVANLKPRSVRSRRTKPPPGHDNAGIVETDPLGKMHLDKMKQEDAKRGLKILTEDGNDKKAEEEGTMDRLLTRYSMKQSRNEQGKSGAAHEPPSRHAAVGTSNDTRNKSKDCPPARAKSFPLEPVSRTEATKGPARASSFQPDKRLDYDDFVARLAALKGK